MPFRSSIDMAGKLRIFFWRSFEICFFKRFLCLQKYKPYKQKKAVEARLLWYKTHGGDIPNFEKDEADLFGSEAKLFEVIQGTKVGKKERHFN